MKPFIDLRPVETGDRQFLQRVYASSREDELAPLDWPQSQKNGFLAMQFDTQRRYYEQAFPEADYLIIQIKNRPVGRLYLDRRDDEIRIVDIALLTKYRGKGIGSRLLNDILAEAGERDVPVRIHVETNNPALRLYKRLGFTIVGNDGVYYLLEWTPQGSEKNQEQTT